MGNVIGISSREAIVTQRYRTNILNDEAMVAEIATNMLDDGLISDLIVIAMHDPSIATEMLVSAVSAFADLHAKEFTEANEGTYYSSLTNNDVSYGQSLNRAVNIISIIEGKANES